MSEKRHLILGGGPAGMAAADELATAGKRPLLLDREDAAGGLCRTLEFKRFLFDIGGHRFLTPFDEVRKIWLDVMGDDMLRVSRMSRIFYEKKFFRYPLTATNALFNLGAVESLRCVASFLQYHVKPVHGTSFETWMCNRFGKRLYEIFFKTYTEKLWGIPCHTLSADWAEQRIEGLSLLVALKRALVKRWGRGPKTLSEEFLYPRTGPGEFYRRYQAQAALKGAEFRHGSLVTKIHHADGEVVSVEARNIQTGEVTQTPAETVISSLPLPMVIEMLDPAPPDVVRRAAAALRFRNYLVVNVILSREKLFPDQWIYVQSPEVRLARIQNYKNWSSAMVPDPRMTSLGLEYFASTDDDFWNLPDSELVAWAMSDLDRIGLASRNDLVDAFVVRQKNAYPIYSLGYRENLDTVRRYLDGLPTLVQTGRAGLFRYCNSDLALLSGLYAARNLVLGQKNDLWSLG